MAKRRTYNPLLVSSNLPGGTTLEEEEIRYDLRAYAVQYLGDCAPAIIEPNSEIS